MKPELSIEEKMAYIRKALEMGADIEVKFHDFRDKEEAEKVAEELSNLIQIPYEERSYNASNWFKIRNEERNFETNIYFDVVEKKEAI